MNPITDLNPADDNWLAEDFAADVQFCQHCGAVVDADGISIEPDHCEWCKD